jgi:hypothetical protein
VLGRLPLYGEPEVLPDRSWPARNRFNPPSWGPARELFFHVVAAFTVDEIMFRRAAIEALSECIGRLPAALRLKARANGRHTGKWTRVCLSAPHLGSVYCSPSEF